MPVRRISDGGIAFFRSTFFKSTLFRSPFFRITFLSTTLASLLAAGQCLSQPQPQPQPPPQVPQVKVGGYLQVRETYQKKAGLMASLNRARLSAEGALPASFTYRMLVEYQSITGGSPTAGVSLRDALIRWTHGSFTVTGGQFKTPFSREYMTSIVAVETADRSGVAEALASRRDIGVMAEYAAASSATFAAGVWNGEGQNGVVNRDSVSLVVGRVTARPIPSLHLGAAAARYSEDDLRLGLELGLEERGFLLKTEYIEQTQAKDVDDYGWYVLGGYRVRPWVQLVARQEDLRRPAAPGTVRNTATTLGANLEFGGGKTRLLFNFVSRESGSPARRREIWLTQLQVRF